MKKLALVALLLPLAAFAEPPAGRGGPGDQPDPAKFEKMTKRMKLARNLGLAEVLDLDTAQTAKLAEALSKVDDRRIALVKPMRESMQLLRKAAQGEKSTAADVDGAIAKLLDLRTQMAALDKETITIVGQGLTPEKKARAALFLARFQRGMHGGMHGGGMGPGRGGPGMNHDCDGPDCGMQRGPGGPGGPGMRGGPGRGGMMGMAPNAWDDDEE
jgi:hypothetical protein